MHKTKPNLSSTIGVNHPRTEVGRQGLETQPKKEQVEAKDR